MMTVKELARLLNECDEDVQNYTVHLITESVINKQLKISLKTKLIEVLENVDVEREILFLRGQ